jgi:hypothetical protein
MSNDDFYTKDTNDSSVTELNDELTEYDVHDRLFMYIIGGGMNMLRYKHLRLDQEKIEKVKKIFQATTETQALDKALEKIIQEDKERLRRRKLMKRIIQLRSSLGKIQEDSSGWVRLARKERTLSV